MWTRWKDLTACLVLIAIAAALWLPGIGWGLPTRESDRWLFGERRPWTGAEILTRLDARQAARLSSAPAVLGEAMRNDDLQMRGADVDVDPILDRSKPVILNDTDAKRASIVQRYRLMSGQPDEFIQFKALAEMSQRTGLARFDPRLYQYGGLWIYPVGALVRSAMIVSLIASPPADVSAREFYLDRPDAFGRFYVVARLYSALWGVIAALGVYAIAKGATTSRVLAFATSSAFIFLPVVSTAAHEAKPHLAGAALCLLAALAAGRFVDTRGRRWLWFAAAMCGAAMAMVVSMVLSLVMLPAAIAAQSARAETGQKREPRLQTSIAALAIALGVYAVTNPFVVLHALVSPGILRSNLGNSTAMYAVRSPLAMFPDACRIAAHALTPIGLWLAMTAVLTLRATRFIDRSRLKPRLKASAAFGSVVTVALLVGVQFTLLAANKPAEYARFGLIPAAAACLVCSVAIRRCLFTPRWFAILFVGTGCFSFLILPVSHPAIHTTVSASSLDASRDAGDHVPRRLGLAYEPAPWSSPPPNLFEQEIFLIDSSMQSRVDVFVWPSNLQSQVNANARDIEFLDWRENACIEGNAP